MRRTIAGLAMLLGSATSSFAQFSMNFDIPGAQIGINVPVYPSLQPIPGYPVYYAPGMSSNYFFYDGLYWVFDGQNWYASSWYNGPWSLVDPLDVPVFVLRVPVRYYRVPPPYFHGWRTSDAPHWGDHWGQSWTSRRTGWDQWNHGSAPAAAPLPTYQKQYSGSRYPQQPSQQASLESRNYRYQPRDPVAQQHFQQARTQAAAAPAQQQPAPQQRTAQEQRPVPNAQSPLNGRQPAPATREQQATRQVQERPIPQHPAPQQQAEHRPQPAPAPVRAQPAPKPQAQPQVTQAERKPPQPQVEHKAPPLQVSQAERQPQRPAQAQQPQAHPQEKGEQRKNEPGSEQNHEGR
ncbi:MAG TPA: hypothetical protein VKR38_00810 [Usitatibacter sp.]|nr:hypothetical protein [Usitatibacter sp.]